MVVVGVLRNNGSANTGGRPPRRGAAIPRCYEHRACREELLENSLQLGGDWVFTSLVYKMQNLLFSLRDLVLNILCFGLGFSFRLDRESHAATTISALASVTMVGIPGTVRRSGRRHAGRTGGMETGGVEEGRETDRGRSRESGGWTPQQTKVA